MLLHLAQDGGVVVVEIHDFARWTRVTISHPSSFMGGFPFCVDGAEEAGRAIFAVLLYRRLAPVLGFARRRFDSGEAGLQASDLGLEPRQGHYLVKMAYDPSKIGELLADVLEIIRKGFLARVERIEPVIKPVDWIEENSFPGSPEVLQLFVLHGFSCYFSPLLRASATALGLSNVASLIQKWRSSRRAWRRLCSGVSIGSAKLLMMI
jgi:hypothetical protein